MLAEQRIDIKRRARVAGGIDGADRDVRAIIGGINLFKVRTRHGKNRCARGWIAGDAAPEAVQLAGQLFFVALAQKIDGGDDAVALPFGKAQRANIGDQPAVPNTHLDLAADLAGGCDHRIGAGRQGVHGPPVKQDLARRAGNFEHHADAAH